MEDASRRWVDSMPEAYEHGLAPTVFRPLAVDLASRAAARSPTRVLELAAGTGTLTAELLGVLTSAAVTATDLKLAMVELGQRSPSTLMSRHDPQRTVYAQDDPPRHSRRRSGANSRLGGQCRGRIWSCRGSWSGGSPGPATVRVVIARSDRVPQGVPPAGPGQGWVVRHYVIIDIFSRYSVDWTVAPGESAELAEAFVARAVAGQDVGKGTLTIHADLGTSMTSKPVAELLADLGAGRTHSRPYASNDNLYSESAFKILEVLRLPRALRSIEDAERSARTSCSVLTSADAATPAGTDLRPALWEGPCWSSLPAPPDGIFGQ